MALSTTATIWKKYGIIVCFLCVFLMCEFACLGYDICGEDLSDQERGANVLIARVMEGKEPREVWSAFNGALVQGRANAHKKYKK